MKQDRKQLFPMIGFAAGVLAIIFAIVVFSYNPPATTSNTYGMDTGTYAYHKSYGGDAYSGIQQAAADTANNVIALAKITRTGFQDLSSGQGSRVNQLGYGFILLVMGLGLIAVSGMKMREATLTEAYRRDILDALRGSKAPDPEKAESKPAMDETPKPASPLYSTIPVAVEPSVPPAEHASNEMDADTGEEASVAVSPTPETADDIVVETVEYPDEAPADEIADETEPDSEAEEPEEVNLPEEEAAPDAADEVAEDIEADEVSEEPDETLKKDADAVEPLL